MVRSICLRSILRFYRLIGDLYLAFLSLSFDQKMLYQEGQQTSDQLQAPLNYSYAFRHEGFQENFSYFVANLLFSSFSSNRRTFIFVNLLNIIITN